jgi:hypothetical protein
VTDEFYRAGKFPAQDRLGAAVIGIAVRMAAGEIVAGVVSGRIEMGRVGAAEAALDAAQDIAAVLCIENAVRREHAAGGTG